VKVTIERATKDQLSSIAELAARIWRAHYPGIISSEQIEFMLAQMFAPEEMERQLAAGTLFDRLLVDGQLIGFVAHGPIKQSDEHRVDKLYVLPKFQRNGFGSRLLKHVIDWAESGGSQSVALAVNKRNETAIAAYQKNGFAIRESVVTDIGHGFVMDDYVMSKSL
jgi:GNAT superfamily N-acetyltransferase